MGIDQFPFTYGANPTSIWNAIEPRRDGSIDVKGRRKISLKALDFREFAGLAGKQLRGAESSAGTCPRLSSKTP
jgi:hypothetical protein